MSPTASLEQLVASHEQFLNFVKSRVRDGVDAEDILQISLIRAVERIDGLRDEERLVPWFYQILRNAITDSYRKQGRERETELPANFDLAEEQDAERRLCDCFAELLPTIRPEYAELIESLDLRNEESINAARRLGISLNNLKVRHHRARQALRRSLEDTCRVCAEHHCLDCTCK